VVSGPTHGTLSGTAPNVTYTADSKYTGSDSFTFVANDGSLDSNVATVSITIQSSNHPPVAGDVSVSTAEGVAVPVGLVASDVDGDPLGYSVVSGPAHGSLSGQAPQLVYTPDAGFYGSDSFTYSASDGAASSNVATVSVSVDGTPTAVDDVLSTHLHTALTLPDLTANDTDPEGEPLTVVAASVTQPAHGTLDAGVYTPDAGFVGDDSFHYAVTDGHSTSTPATVIIHVTDNPPVAGPDAATLDQDTSAQLDVLANDSDPDGDALTTALYSGPQHGTASLTADGTLVYKPAPGFYGSDSITYLVTDGGLTVPGLVTLTVKRVNHPPTVSLAPAGPVDEGAAPIPLVATASDPDAGQTLVTTWTTDVGTVTTAADGTATFSADDGPASAHVVVTVCDNGEPVLCAHDSQTIQVRNVAPAVTASAAPVPQYWGLPVHFSATASDPSTADTDAGLAYAWSFGATPLTADHAYAAPGTYAATFTAKDKDGGVGTADAQVAIQKRTTALAFTAPLTQPFGPASLTATLSDTVDAPTANLGGRTVVFAAGGHTYPATTDAAGRASVSPAPFLLSGPVTVTFAGDSLYLPSSTTVGLTIQNAFGSANGFFAVGDLSAAQNAAVTFWGARWWTSNLLSGGSAPAQFKGFVDAPPPAACGGTWTTRPGNSSNPPDTLGTYVAVAVPTRISAKGSTLSGDAPHVVAVRVASGYGPAPGHAGTGVVVGSVC
jgi:hypothetical protein